LPIGSIPQFLIASEVRAEARMEIAQTRAKIFSGRLDRSAAFLDRANS